MKVNSLDPRISRADIPKEDEYGVKKEMDQWQTYEVFHQSARGKNHVHVGSVHAPNSEMAFLFAKEQYARRMACVNIWVVKTEHISTSEYEDSDMFEPGMDKSYREGWGYKNKHIIQEYKERQKSISKS